MRYLTSEERKSSLQDRHKDEVLYIIGCGPSLTLNFAEMLEQADFLTLGVNKSFKVLRTTYHLHVDYDYPSSERQFSALYENYLEAMINEGSYLFAPLNHDYQKTTGWACQYFYTDFQSAFTSRYDDELKVLNLGHSSTGIFQALQLAVIMGFKKIYLVGVDFYLQPTREGFAKMHAYEYQNKLLPQEKRNTENKLVQFERDLEKKAKPELDKFDVTVFNLSANSKLKAFERLNIIDD